MVTISGWHSHPIFGSTSRICIFNPASRIDIPPVARWLCENANDLSPAPLCESDLAVGTDLALRAIEKI